MTTSAGRILVVDDEPAIRRILMRLLQHAGYEVVEASDGLNGVGLIRDSTFDLVISDLQMPGMGGMDLLRRVRELDLDLPVILMTGNPSIETAVAAVEYGALRYLTKPLDLPRVTEAAQFGVRMRQLARLKREATAHLGAAGEFPGDRAGLETRFGSALDAVWMAYQPIVSYGPQEVYAYEGLLRSDESTMADPGSIIDAAERLARVSDLGRVTRARMAESIDALDDQTLLFVNLHPQDLQDDELVSPSSPLSAIARRVVLEVTERAALDGITNLRERTAELRRLGFRIALDDLGAGYAGIASLVQLQPEVVKLDMSLVRRIDTDSTKQRLVQSMTRLCRDMGILVVAEGVETKAEHDTVVALGCDLFQGYIFARPTRTFEEPVWPA